MRSIAIFCITLISLLGIAPSSARADRWDYIDAFDPVMVAELFIEGCFSHGLDFELFNNFARRRYYAPDARKIQPLLGSLGLRRAYAWSPAKIEKDVYVVANMDRTCVVTGRVKDYEMLHLILPDVMEFHKYHNVPRWERGANIKVRIDREGRARRFRETTIVIENDISLSNEYIWVSTYDNHDWHDFVIRYGRVTRTILTDPEPEPESE